MGTFQTSFDSVFRRRAPVETPSPEWRRPNRNPWSGVSGAEWWQRCSRWDWWCGGVTSAPPDSHRIQKAALYLGTNTRKPWDTWLHKVCRNPHKPGGPVPASATDTFHVIAPWLGLERSWAVYPAHWPSCEPSSAGLGRWGTPSPKRPRIPGRHRPPPAWAAL